MKLADEIIESLSSEKSSLTEALLKTKILLHKIGHKELVDWVNNELNGYPDSVEVPTYRILPAQVLANVASIAYQFNSHPIPIGHLTKAQREGLEISKMNQSLAVLEKLVEKNDGHLQAPIPMEYNGVLGKNLVSGMQIQRAWCSISIADVNGIFIQVRSRLLDFLLELNEKLPDDLNEAEIKNRSDEIDAAGMFKNAIFGDNVTIVVGTANSPTATNIKTKGDVSVLLNELRKNNVPESELILLNEAIEADVGKVNEKTKKFGPSVRAWLDKMLSKVADASWQIELNIASNVLTSALQHYYGWV
jgi:hypothetical protein